ncbi:7823_t:CDS:10, partial [Scutellospora calospora]
MGWSPGKGLGMNEDGSQECIKLSHKLDNLGIGVSKKTIDNWLDNSNAFDKLLKGLNQQDQANVTEEVAQNHSNDLELGHDLDVIKASKSKKKKVKKDKLMLKNKKKDKLDFSKSNTINKSNVNTISSSIRLAHRAKYLESKKAATKDSERLKEIFGIKAKSNVESISDFKNNYKISQDDFENVINSQNNSNKNEKDYFSDINGVQTIVNKLSTQDYFSLKAKKMNLTESASHFEDKSDERPCFNLSELTNEDSIGPELVTEGNEERNSDYELHNNFKPTANALETRGKRKDLKLSNALSIFVNYKCFYYDFPKFLFPYKLHIAFIYYLSKLTSIPRISPRFGTIILAAVSFFVSSWFAVVYLAKPGDYVPDMSRGLTLVFGIAFIIMALVSLFGIIGSLFEIQTAILQNRQYEVDNCVKYLQKQPGYNSTSTSLDNDSAYCTHYEIVIIIRNIVTAILLILFSILFARVSSVYAQKLETRSRSKRLPATSLTSVASVSTTDFNPTDNLQIPEIDPKPCQIVG